MSNKPKEKDHDRSKPTSPDTQQAGNDGTGQGPILVLRGKTSRAELLTDRDTGRRASPEELAAPLHTVTRHLPSQERTVTRIVGERARIVGLVADIKAQRKVLVQEDNQVGLLPERKQALKTELQKLGNERGVARCNDGYG